ncbi:ABC transporter ATP-binding protein [Vogesella indigofera]|uniref:ABC transporter ATP-binding protein n=1 Tax=Vogesella indigofera TaxID=45465 RepID=UPI00234EEC69|nr:ABC transporter ATP-binding protein [Vogesella indigofera]MDC7698403.1 ABC transporter ATP-binding protein [Vogesella indigofera]
MPDLAYQIERLQVRRGNDSLLDCQQLQIPAHRVTAVIAAHAPEHSLLLQALAGAHGRQQGRLFGQPLPQAGRHDARIAGLAPAATNPRQRLWDYVRQGRLPASRWLLRPSPLDRDAATLALRLVALEAQAGQRLANLTPSEQQLARIARSLAQPAPLLLLDQWTAHLSIQQQLLLMQQLARLAPTGRTIVCTLPEHSPAASHAQWLVLLAGGRLLAQGSPAQLRPAASEYPPHHAAPFASPPGSQHPAATWPSRLAA